MNIQNISGVSQIVSVGSVDGVLATAGFLRGLHLCGQDTSKVGLTFTQPHLVDKIKIDWKEKQIVAFIDLPVNNVNPQMTADFVQKITGAGHQILVVADEHDRPAWEKMLDVSQLQIQPQSRADQVNTSASKILKNCFGNQVDQHTHDLLDAGDEADNLVQNVTHKYAVMVNEATKSNIMDSTRRVYLAMHLALNTEQDAQIAGWREEYRVMAANKPLILAKRQDLGKGLAHYDANSVGLHDPTAIFGGAYAKGDRVVVLRSMRDGKPIVSIAKNDKAAEVKNLDLKAVLEKGNVPHLGGMAARINVAVDQEDAAIQVILSSL